MLLGYKPVQHVTVLNTVGNCNTVISIIILYYYNIMGPPSYMRSVFDRNVGMRRITVYCHLCAVCLRHITEHYLINSTIFGRKKIIEHKICVLILSTTLV